MTLLFDALERTLKEAQCARRWHQLMAIWLDSHDPQARRSVLDILRQLPDGDPRADILRLTFLAKATGNSRFETEAAVRVLQLAPSDPDRLAAFMAYGWLSALQHISARPDFVAALYAGRVPEMAGHLMLEARRLLPPELAPRATPDVRRVALVAPYIGHRFHTPSRMAADQAAILAGSGVQVQIFSAQELLPPDAAQFRGDGSELGLPALDAQTWADLLPAGVRMTVSDSRFSLPGRWRNLLPALAAFDPDAILLVGLYSPLAAALHAVRPVVGISVNTVAPIAPLDIWLAADADARDREVWSQVFPAPRTLFHPYRLKRSTAEHAVTRAELGLDPAAMVWVSAGFRLEHEIHGEWAERMLRLMTRHPQVVWLLIGGEGKLPQALENAPAGRVRALATRDDLPGILRISDIYVNPPRMGGGISVAEAMAEGLPVTALAGSDGGDKLGDLALADLDAYDARLAALSANAQLRAEMGTALRRRFDERLDLAASGPALLAACRQAAELARVRLTRPS